MDRKSPPERSSTDPPDMATMVIPTNLHHPSAGVNKRYRPTPAKTFQCRGFGDCRMVFSRSEHLARHIRKHTGERPFGCHCGKQFSRLDNLRQHAQTVHADKQEQNEVMMRHLTSLHASMAAANKSSGARGGRRPNPSPSHGVTAGLNSSGSPMNIIKQEDSGIKIQQRPGTSTGYEGDHNGLLYHSGATWHVQQADMERPDSRPSNNHSFRDPGQSFLISSSSSTAAAAPSHSFLPFSSTFNFSLPDPTRGDVRPGTSSSRPPTAGSLADPNSRSLPPLSAVVSASLSTPSQQQQSFFTASSHQQQQQSSLHVLPLPNPYALRRPSTSIRPGTAPASASFFSSKSSGYGGTGLVSRPELYLSYGRSGGGLNSDVGAAYSNNYDAEPASPAAGHDSPFFFQPRSLGSESQRPAAAAALPSGTGNPSSSPSFNPRKRAFAGPDGPQDASYEHGSESRPQSRRLSVLELCNDNGGPNATPGPFLLSQPASAATAATANIRAPNNPRPDTASGGLVSSASALAIVDSLSPVSSSSNSPLLTGVIASPGGTATPGAYAGTGRSGGQGEEELGRNRLSTSPQPSAAAAATTTKPFRFDISSVSPLSHHRTGSGGTTTATSFTHASTIHSTPSSSPSIGPRSPGDAGSSPGFPSRRAVSPLTDATATSSISRRTHGTGDGQHDQVRISVPPHATPALGMRV
ncbi:hypothetical protein AMATHDRAFT_54646 [Amanita thiersii Skay4041]|uniref:C2H2-type domain-containing protein n=1 Tax=Amanita thiersii Skay4041 TaxID=703135 RepID=A0A2A9NSJ2_9AGAR|nr:hypothetical protein AMATHDRAFT_54646 [Amanita thiersii Skay4041]